MVFRHLASDRRSVLGLSQHAVTRVGRDMQIFETDQSHWTIYGPKWWWPRSDPAEKTSKAATGEQSMEEDLERSLRVMHGGLSYTASLMHMVHMDRLKRIELGVRHSALGPRPPSTRPTLTQPRMVYSTESDYDSFGLGIRVVGFQLNTGSPRDQPYGVWLTGPIAHRSPGFSITNRRPVSVSLSPGPLVARKVVRAWEDLRGLATAEPKPESASRTRDALSARLATESCHCIIVHGP